MPRSEHVQKGKGSEVSAFSLESLRWSKIIICTDADEDGFQIRTLLLTLFYRLLPTLLKEGKVFIAETPLFEITTKDRTLFAFDEFEKAEILKKLGNQKYTLQRSKGLGENEPEMMWETTMNPATRRLVAVTPTDAEATERIFDTLLGDNLPARKKFITENGDRYTEGRRYTEQNIRDVMRWHGSPDILLSSRADEPSDAIAQRVGKAVDIVNGVLRAEAHAKRAVGVGGRKPEGEQRSARSARVRRARRACRNENALFGEKMQHRLASDARKGETYYVSRGVCRKVEPHAGCGQHIERMAVKLVHVCRVAFGVFACLRAGTGEARDVYQVFCPRAEALLLPAAVNDGREALGAYHSWCDAKCAHTLGTVYFMRTDAHKVGAEACRGEFDSIKPWTASQ